MARDRLPAIEWSDARYNVGVKIFRRVLGEIAASVAGHGRRTARRWCRHLRRGRNANSILYVVAPYRDREAHLREFVGGVNARLGALGMDYRILIAEQSDDGLFNKGLLYNVAMKYIEEERNPGKNVYVCLHDIDILPNTVGNYGRPLDGAINHLYGYPFCLGGVFLVNLEDYARVNGFPNVYEGWGYEDMEYQRRSTIAGIRINRDNFEERFSGKGFRELDHDEKAPSRKMGLPQTRRNEALFAREMDPRSDGLNQLARWRECTTITVLPDHTVIHCRVDRLKALNGIRVPD